MTFIKLPERQASLALHLLGELPQLRAMDSAALNSVLVDASLARFGEGEGVFDQGQPADYWYLVLQGRIDTLRYGADGEERVIQHLSAGQLLAPIVMFTPQRRYPVSARAAKASELCRLRRDRLRDACLKHPQLALQILELAAVALGSRIDDVDSLAGCNAAQRLAAYLLQQANVQGMAIELPLSQRQLAAKLGVRAETLSRLLAEWQKNGYVIGRRQHWQLTEPDTLRQLAGR
jgi:CRP-like cAMP-binding protein